MPDFVLALDQGTTATTAVVVGKGLEVMGKASNEIEQIYPRPGWVEHDPESIWKTSCLSAVQAMEKAQVSGSECVAVGITNQRETTIVWDGVTGSPVYNGIVWQCRRTSDTCAALKERGLERLFRERTGLVLDPYFSGTKLAWILDNVAGAREGADSGRLRFGTVDSFLVYRLTGGRSHVTDVSNASRTLLMDIRKLEWDEELLEVLGVPALVLPTIVPSAGVMGHTLGLDFLPDGIPISGAAGDQQAALFGQTCFEQGRSKCTYGTGAFLLMNTGDRPVPSSHGLLSTVAWKTAGKTSYALEGSAFIAGAAVQWLRDQLGLIRSAPEVEALASTVPDSGGVIFVPALAGLGAPYWRPEARGALLGITRSTGAGHVARAVLEGIAMQITDLALAMEKDLGKPLPEMRVDGGAAANDILMQFQADVLGVPVTRPANLDTTAMGAAMLSGIGVGLWDTGDLEKMAAIDRVYEPSMDEGERNARLDIFRKAVDLTSSFGVG